MVGPLVGLAPFEPINSVTPFTYRDNATYLTILHGLQKKLTELIDAFNEANSSQSNNLDAKIAQLRAELTLLVDNLQAEVISLIEGSHDESIAFDPTNGSHVEGLSTVISRVYDNLRIYAYFARQYDELNWTAKQYDDMDLSARHYDLGATYPTFNDTQED